jgi:hypothetical protein
MPKTSFFKMHHLRFKRRNTARYVMIADGVFKTICEIDKHGTLITTTSVRLPVLPVLNDIQQPTNDPTEPGSQVHGEETATQASILQAEDGESGQIHHKLSFQDPVTIFSMENLLT